MASLFELLKKRLEALPQSEEITLYPKNEVAIELFEYFSKSGRKIEIVNNISVNHKTICICADSEKENYLEKINSIKIKGYLPNIIVGGIEHSIKNQRYMENIEAKNKLTSHAVGYNYTKAHLYECLKKVKDENLKGFIVELGTFEAGTLGLLEKVSYELGINKRVKLIGFDTWDGEIHRRQPMDAFNLTEWAGKSMEKARENVSERVDLIRGDIIDTFPKWIKSSKGKIVFAFIDTDNYSAVKNALPLLWKRLSVGGSVVFDHYYTEEEYVDTLGERIAAKEFFKNRTDFFNLTGTGVFFKTK
ncbi:MAG TPA: class I SAM-dependent methyltransferase [Candidatus Nanoarchaeia archaeon]|nr:class I SAM-dependent methyltransferase [Candidatus Nanoarchaeia archaeon]